MGAYTIVVRPRARRSLRQLDTPVRKAVAEAIDGLAVDPRPAGFLPLTGHRPYLRVRSGDGASSMGVRGSATGSALYRWLGGHEPFCQLAPRAEKPRFSWVSNQGDGHVVCTGL